MQNVCRTSSAHAAVTRKHEVTYNLVTIGSCTETRQLIRLHFAVARGIPALQKFHATPHSMNASIAIASKRVGQLINQRKVAMDDEPACTSPPLPGSQI